jgi:hypothetical protein
MQASAIPAAFAAGIASNSTIWLSSLHEKDSPHLDAGSLSNPAGKRFMRPVLNLKDRDWEPAELTAHNTMNLQQPALTLDNLADQDLFHSKHGMRMAPRY